MEMEEAMMGDDFGLMADLAMLNDPDMFEKYKIGLSDDDYESEAEPQSVLDINMNEIFLFGDLAPEKKAISTIVPQEQSEQGVQEVNTNEIMNSALAPETNATHNITPEEQSEQGVQKVNTNEINNSVLAPETNTTPYIVPQGQSEQGLAGLFGLTLEQVQSGVRNKSVVEKPKVVSVRNTAIEKPKPASTRSLYQNAGVKKSKGKVVASPIHVQAEGEKTRAVRSASIAGLQSIGKPHIAIPVDLNLPPFITAGKLEEIKKMANATAFPVYVEAVKQGILKAQREAMVQQGAYQPSIQPSAQHALYQSTNDIMELNPYNMRQPAAYHTQQQHPAQAQALDQGTSIDGNPMIPNISQQQIGSRTPSKPLMQRFQAMSYTTPPGAYEIPQHSFAQGNQDPFYPATLITPPSVGHAMSYGPSMNASQLGAYQAPNDLQMNGFNFQQQAPQMGAYHNMLQDWQFAQPGQQVQQPVLYPMMQQPQQKQARYYAPIPAQQQNKCAPQYDPQNQAQLVAQQHRMQQDQMQFQQLQQPGMQYQPTTQDNINCSSKMIAQANASDQKRQFKVNDFVNQRQ